MLDTAHFMIILENLAYSVVILRPDMVTLTLLSSLNPAIVLQLYYIYVAVI